MLFIINNSKWPTSKVRFFQIKDELESKTNLSYLDVFNYKLKNTILKTLRINIFFKYFLFFRIKSLLKKQKYIYLIKIFDLEILEFICKNKKPEQKVIFDVNDAFFLDSKGQKSSFTVNHLKYIDALVFENYMLKESMLKKFHLYFSDRPKMMPTIIIEDIPNIDISVPNKNLAEVNQYFETINFIWVGSESSIGPLFKIYELLEFLATTFRNIKLVVLGADFNHAPRFENLNVKFVKNYNESIMIEHLSNSHFGLFPTYNNQDSKLRGLHKIRNYMAFGVIPIVDEKFDIINTVSLDSFLLKYSILDNEIRGFDYYFTNGLLNGNWKKMSIQNSNFIKSTYSTNDYVVNLWNFVNNNDF